MNYKQHKIFRREEGYIIIYVCLERLKDSFFCVHQLEKIPVNQIKGVSLEIENNFLEIFSESDPNKTLNWFSNIESAISNHDKEFGNIERK